MVSRWLVILFPAFVEVAEIKRKPIALQKERKEKKKGKERKEERKKEETKENEVRDGRGRGLDTGPYIN